MDGLYIFIALFFMGFFGFIVGIAYATAGMERKESKPHRKYEVKNFDIDLSEHRPTLGTQIKSKNK